MSATALLKKPDLNVVLFPAQPKLRPNFGNVSRNPFPASFDVVVIPQHEWRPAEIQVFMQTGEKRMQIDAISASSLGFHDVGDKAEAVQRAYTKSHEKLSVTFQTASEKPNQMAGWTVSGDENRFVLKIKPEIEILRNIAYVTGTGARARLGLNSEPVEGKELAYLHDIRRAQMIFDYR